MNVVSMIGDGIRMVGLGSRQQVEGLVEVEGAASGNGGLMLMGCSCRDWYWHSIIVGMRSIIRGRGGGLEVE